MSLKIHENIIEKLDNFIFLFDKKDCMQYKKVNEISLKLDVSNCL